MAYKTVTKKKSSNKHICSNCINEFDAKDIFEAIVPEREYSTNYCAKCLKELGIEEFKPYLKPRKPRAKKVADVEVETEKKATKTKKATATKTKKATATKTKKTTKKTKENDK